MRSLLAFGLAMLVGFIFSGCGYFEDDSDEVQVIYKDINCDDEPEAEECKEPEDKEKEEISFSDVKKIIDARCISCHESQAPKLTGKPQIEGAISGVKKVVAAGRMPPTGPLSDEEKAVIAGYNP